MTARTTETELDRACVEDTPEVRRSRILRLDQHASFDDFRLITIIRLGVCDFNRVVEEMTTGALGMLISDVRFNVLLDYLRQDPIRFGAIWQTVNNRFAVSYTGGGRAALLPEGLRIIPTCSEIFGYAALGGYAPAHNAQRR